MRNYVPFETDITSQLLCFNELRTLLIYLIALLKKFTWFIINHFAVLPQVESPARVCSVPFGTFRLDL